MADGDLMDLQEVLQALSITEQDLQNMVAQGKLKAVRAGRTVKFRRAEVLSMKSGRSTEPTIIIPQAQIPSPAGRKIDESAATVVPEAPAGGVVPVETQAIEDEELEILPLEDEAAATQTEAPVAVEEEVTVAEEVQEEAPAAATPSSRRSTGRVSRRASQIMYSAQESPVWTGVLAFTILITLFVGSILGTILLKGYYDEEARTRYVPSFLSWVYDSFKDEGGAK